MQEVPKYEILLFILKKQKYTYAPGTYLAIGYVAYIDFEKLLHAVPV